MSEENVKPSSSGASGASGGLSLMDQLKGGVTLKKVILKFDLIIIIIIIIIITFEFS